jgi:hypothetical protein
LETCAKVYGSWLVSDPFGSQNVTVSNHARATLSNQHETRKKKQNTYHSHRHHSIWDNMRRRNNNAAAAGAIASGNRTGPKSFVLVSLILQLSLLACLFPRTVHAGILDAVGLSSSEKEDDDKRLWGSPTPALTGDAASSESASSSSSSSSTASSDTDIHTNQRNNISDDSNSKNNNNNNNNNSGSSSSSGPATIPFVAKTTAGSSGASKSQQQQQEYYYDVPPQGFRLTSRVYTDPTDKLAHFDHDVSNQFVLPYWECGVSGSTTIPIPSQHVTIKHLLASSKPNRYSGTENGPHPQLIIPLTNVDIVLNSGETQSFEPGHVILMEDVVSDGHKLLATTTTTTTPSTTSGSSPKASQANKAPQDVTVMIITLAQNYHHVGKDHMSLKQHATSISTKNTPNPCKDAFFPARARNNLDETSGTRSAGTATSGSFGTDVSDEAMLSFQNRLFFPRPSNSVSRRNFRKFVLALIGVSVSALLGDFFGKVAPLWLAVGVGGVCLVAGGTVAFVKLGDYCIEEVEMWAERRRLQLEEVDENDPNDNASDQDERDESDSEPPSLTKPQPR